MNEEILADAIHDVLAVRGCHHPRFGPWECRLVVRKVQEAEAEAKFLQRIGPAPMTDTADMNKT